METVTLSTGHVASRNTKTGALKATCIFCEKEKATRFMGKGYNGLNNTFAPIWICNACQKSTGFEAGDEEVETHAAA